MTKTDAIAFIGAINALQPYVPPLLFERVVGSAVSSQLVMIAQGVVTATIAPVASESPGATGDGA